MDVLLNIEDLVVAYRLAGEEVAALCGVSLCIRAGESLGIVGESGSAKTTLALAIPALLPAAARVVRGSVRFDGREMLRLRHGELRRIRGARIGTIFQEPALMLSPVLTVGRQITDVLRSHCEATARDAHARSIRLLQLIGFSDPDRILRSYPHELSGGERQRVVIAQAVICRPELIIADEPTSSLDGATQAEILVLLRRLQREFGSALLLISHDPAVIRASCERVVVLQAGQIVEEGKAACVFGNPAHPYTRALLSARESLTRRDKVFASCGGTA